MNPHIKTIVKLLESCRYRHDVYTVFSDCMETMAIACSNAVDQRQFAKREARYLEIVRRYDSDVLASFPKILAEVTMAMQAEPSDVLGAVFGQLELSNTSRGQFFTPFELCRLMARLQIGDGADARAIIAREGYVSASEPACGAGAMIIALAEAMHDAGINYQRHLHVVAVDVDPRAAHMAYVQFTLLHIPAVVIVGNTLAMEEREHWYTPAHVLGGWSGRLAARKARDNAAASRQEVVIPPALPNLTDNPRHRQADQLTLF
ncbi:N-6 DNA methylase [Xanthomonas campestris pv. campestris]|nr:N-6 DNA methylase [Xanthomonas campestris pv. campestris]MEB1789652.1 N-6 DNA methylase [Xanthomonas campestris pv. campestris]MEB1844534.1 N-6 DNA methylase [Xanthomonas campestris pv. campestris]MEB1878294.1 N-6 DNA methylase [Xanthomonas campestris pv. campestris]